MSELVSESTNINEEAGQLMKFHGSYQQDDREKRTLGQGKYYQFMMRTRQPAGTVTNQLYLTMDDLSNTVSTWQSYILSCILQQYMSVIHLINVSQQIPDNLRTIMQRWSLKYFLRQSQWHRHVLRCLLHYRQAADNTVHWKIICTINWMGSKSVRASIVCFVVALFGLNINSLNTHSVTPEVVAKRSVRTQTTNSWECLEVHIVDSDTQLFIECLIEFCEQRPS